MKLGIDTYSFHRIFGDRRGEEAVPTRQFPRGSLDAIAVAVRVGSESIALQTCFLDPPGNGGTRDLRAAIGELEPIIAWGHPEGLAFGTAPEAGKDLERWIEVARDLGCQLVRFVAGNSNTDRGGRPIEFLAEALEGPLRTARQCGIELAIENHADLTVADLEALLAHVDDPALGICLDTANAIRVGDLPLDATVRLLPRLRMLHLKDVAGVAFDKSVGPRSVAYGTGVVPVQEIVSTLADSNFQGHVLVELGYLGPGLVDEEELVQASLTWLADARSRLG